MRKVQACRGLKGERIRCGCVDEKCRLLKMALCCLFRRLAPLHRPSDNTELRSRPLTIKCNARTTVLSLARQWKLRRGRFWMPENSLAEASESGRGVPPLTAVQSRRKSDRGKRSSKKNGGRCCCDVPNENFQFLAMVSGAVCP